MKTETFYISEDGKKFDNKEECEKYEESIKSESCSICEGDGGSYIADGHDCWGNYETTFVKCDNCCGSGIKDKHWYERKALLDKLEKVQMDIFKLGVNR